MIYLLCSIASASVLFILFKLFPRYGVETVPAIVLNYLIAAVFGLTIAQPQPVDLMVWKHDWFTGGVIIGATFIVMFILIALSAQRIGSGITAVSNKMSVVIPVVFAFFLYGDTVSPMKVIAIIVTLAGVLMATKIDKVDHPALFYLPLIIFVSNGLLDTYIKYIEVSFLNESNTPLFIPTLFCVAFILGLAYALISGKMKLNRNTVVGGIILGVVNYASIYFLLKTLAIKTFENSVIYPLNNVGIVIFTTVLALVIFRERLTRLNWLGISASSIGLILLMLSYSNANG